MTDETEDNYAVVEGSRNQPIQLVGIDVDKAEQLENDYDEAKANLIALADKNAAAIDDLMEFAKSAQHHLVYVALAAMIKAQNETNKEIGQLNFRKQELLIHQSKINNNAAGPVAQNVTNNLYMTSTEAIDLIKRNRGLVEDSDGSVPE